MEDVDDVVTDREPPDGKTLGNNKRKSCKFHYPSGSAVTVGSKVLFVSACI